MSGENTKCYHDNNGDRFVAGSGGEISWLTGSVISTTKGLGTVGPTAGIALQTISSVGGTRELIATLHRTVLTLTSVVVSMVDHTTAGSQGSVLLYTFAVANILILGASANLTTVGDGTGVTTTSALVGSIGTVAVGAGDATLTSTEANICPSAVGTLTASAGVLHMASTAPLTADGSAAAITVNLNLATPDAGSTANGTVTVSGTVTFVWVDLGLSQ